MKKLQVFLDTNVLISGIFFSGPESLLLKQAGIDFITSNINYNEVIDVAKRKFRKLKVDVLQYALEKIEDTFIDIKIIDEKDWKQKLGIASKYLKDNDQKILAAILCSMPDYFVTGDRDFHNDEIRKIVNVIKTKALLKILEID